MSYLLGLDDTDSRFGHCTTHLGYLIVSELARIGCTFSAYPRLVRLNPNIPFKTRGNAAVCIEFEASSSGLRDVAFEAAERLLEAEADVANGANSALVMAPKDSDDLPFFREVYQRAVSGVVNYKGVIRAVSERGIRHKLLGNGMGLVGATASLGFSCELDDHTYELIAYREPENCGTPRAVEPESVKEMEAETFPHTFNSYDHESGRVLVTPSGPDPVLSGVRGDSPRAALDAFRSIRMGEEALGHVIYATNQCTDAHLTGRLSTPLSAYSAGWFEGVIVSTRPSRGGHLTLQLRADDSSTATCMVYEPSGDLRRVARLLQSGDSVRVSGGVRRASSKNPVVVNVERIDVLKVSREAVRAAPRCAACGSGMKSEGRGKGYQCKSCGRKSAEPARARRAPKLAEARISPGAYLPSPRSQRHLTKQLIRYGREQVGMHPLIERWVEPPSTPRLELPRLSAQATAPRKA
ncbi:MAG TPA: tRNA(Ile)(2)-agmatinylcytidine synthase [Nitrososphaerales archaeon]|nr:tRNA(Ile)(2)-agmatinylcytidine synthase [Nitrososphaerales archaeon]